MKQEYIRVEKLADIIQMREIIDDILSNPELHTRQTADGQIEISDSRGPMFTFVMSNVSLHRRAERYQLWMTWHDHPVANILQDEVILNILYKYRSAKTPNIFRVVE